MTECNLCGKEAEYHLESVRHGPQHICRDCAREYGSPEAAAAEAAKREYQEMLSRARG